MKRIAIIVLFMVFQIHFSYSQNSDTRIKELIAKNAYFDLYKEFPKLKKSSTEFTRLYGEATLNSHFNKPVLAIQNLNDIFAKHISMLDAQLWTNLLIELGNNYVMLNQYNAAAQCFQQVIQFLELQNVQEEVLQNLRTYHHHLASLARLPLLEIDQKDSWNIPFKRDKIGLLTIPVSVNGETIDFVLDYGAGISMIQEKYAQKLGVTIVENDSLFIAGSTGEGKYSKIGYAEALSIGELKLKNVAFSISSGNILDTIIDGHDIKGIIGLDIMRNFERMTFNQNGNILVEKAITSSNRQPNIILYSEKMYAKAKSDRKDLLLQFDSGAPKSYMNRNYYEKYKSDEAKWEKKMITFSGYMSTIQYDSYLINNYPLTIGTKKTKLEMDVVLIDEHRTYPIDGILGLDVFDKNKEMIIDFKNMLLDYK